MSVSLKHQIAAVVTYHKNEVGGGAPVFYVANQEEALKMARTLASILQAGVHELSSGVLILVKH
jgi:hypothetical protein